MTAGHKHNEQIHQLGEYAKSVDKGTGHHSMAELGRVSETCDARRGLQGQATRGQPRHPRLVTVMVIRTSTSELQSRVQLR